MGALVNVTHAKLSRVNGQSVTWHRGSGELTECFESVRRRNGVELPVQKTVVEVNGMIAEMTVETGNPVVMRNIESKRGDRRFIVNQPASLSAPDSPGEVWEARIRDISRRGMQFVLDCPFTGGSRVHISWNGRDIHGAIRYRQQQGGEYRLGVELSSSWDTLVSDILAQQAEELRQSNEALQRTENELMMYAEALKKSNRELAAALDAAREANQAKSRFLASVSHELRTPLNGIIGMSQLLHDEAVGPVTAEQKDCLADVLSCSNHLFALINHVLDLTKIEAGKMDFNYRPISLAEHVTDAVESMRGNAAAKRLELRLCIDSRLEIVRADPARLRQVVLNYLSNALKFTAEAGCITVDVRPEGSRAFRILVEDNGIGIRAEDLPRLFSEFGQLGESWKAKTGAGLGLATTKRIVEAQNGSVGVESVYGEGSRFFAILPCAPPTANIGPCIKRGDAE
jgi:signal transduction histidine kinase